ncbi:nucleotide exchange factor GrpE [Saccharospirillum impatiens]|uniref:nucleotide exchange factor GrpE n=1 Tax=Saccharospirillum impatiens TaxID=169438 RepID=UPI0004150F35|nr:nucleotide exchange factor GrpE [Saccharospirillum impatiens]
MAHEEKPVEAQETDVTQDETLVDDAQAAPEEASVAATEQDLVAELEAVREEAQLSKDRYLRAEAEMVNVRRRVEKDVENAHKYGQEKLVREILDVADNLERTLAAIETETDDVKPLKEGVEMTLKSLLDSFEKFSITVINPEGEPFDPQVHQAMSMVENPDMEPNTVMAVMQKGYALHGRLVRPAMVMVSKGGPAKNSIDETA